MMRDETWGVSPKQLARLLGVSPNHLYELIQEGEIKVVRLGRRLVIPRHELVRLGVLPEAERERGEE